MIDGAIHTADTQRVCEACADILGHRPAAATPDAIADVASHVEWRPFPGWEQMSDDEIARRAGLFDVGMRGEILIVTEASLSSGRGAFAVQEHEVERLVSEHGSRFGECFFNGDVVIVSTAARQIWLFHHEGQVALIRAG